MVLKFSGINKRFGKREILSSIDFNVSNGEIFGLIGKSGCGKTTLLKILMGTLKPTKGTILFEGKNTIRNPKFLKKNTGFSTQDNTLIPELTVWENAIYFGKLYRLKNIEIKMNFQTLSGLLGLERIKNSLVKNLSGGMKKRANFLVSLIHNPDLLILDEPTAGLDPIMRENIWQYIKNINSNGTTILVTSHRLEEIEENCDRIGILKNGEIADVGNIDELRNKYGTDSSLNEIFEAVINKQ